MRLSLTGLLALVVPVLAACGQGVEAQEGSSEPVGRAQSRLLNLDGVNVNCSTAKIGDVGMARQRYDEHFAPLFPDTEAKFDFQEDTAVLSAAFVKKVVFHTLPEGLGDDLYEQLFSFDEKLFERPDNLDKKNFDIWDQFDPATELEKPYRRYNPRDYTPTSTTYYARSETNDVMANQVVYQYACNPKFKAALDSCTDCADSWVPLACSDVGTIFEMRYARVVNGKLEVSKPFKIIGTDCSGDMTLHSQTDLYLFGKGKVEGEWLRARWRGEISGKLADVLGTTGGPTPALVRKWTEGGTGGSSGAGGAGGAGGAAAGAGGSKAGSGGAAGSGGSKPKDAGVGGTKVEAGVGTGGTGAAGGGSDSPPAHYKDTSSDGGCAVQHASGERSSWLVAFLLALVSARRLRRRSG